MVGLLIVAAIAINYDNSRRNPAGTETDCLGTLSDCFQQGALKKFGNNQVIDKQEFTNMLDKIDENLKSKTRTSFDPARADYDTPFFNGDDRRDNKAARDPLVCIDNKCSPQSAVNYVAQGMYSANTGQSLESAIKLANSWNKWMYGHQASDDEKYWLEYGYNYYRSKNSKGKVSGATKKIDKMLAME